jgi:hypothetical protein
MTCPLPYQRANLTASRQHEGGVFVRHCHDVRENGIGIQLLPAVGDKQHCPNPGLILNEPSCADFERCGRIAAARMT